VAASIVRSVIADALHFWQTATMRLAMLGFVVMGVSSCFFFERTATLEPGTVRGTATIAGRGTEDVDVTLANSPHVQRADAAGAFAVGGLPAGRHAVRLLRDDDNDGVAERGAVATFAITQMTSGLSGVDLGDVALLGTTGISGVLTDGDGGGLDGATIVVTRFDVDHTAEVLLPIVDDDGDGVIPFTIAGVVPGTVEVFAFAANGRASDVVSRQVGATAINDVELAIVASPAVSVTAQVTPPLSTTQFIVVEVGAPVDAVPVVAPVGVGQFIDVPAGVYDVWFVDDGVTLTRLPRQVARPIDSEITWGPAVRGATAASEGEGEGEGEGEEPSPFTFTASSTPLLVHPDGTSSESAQVLATSTNGPVTITVQPTTLPIAVDFDPATGAVAAHFDETRGVAAADVLLTNEKIVVTLDDGVRTEDHDVVTAYIAHAVFVGTLNSSPGSLENWLSQRAPERNDDNIVVLGELDATGDLTFGAIDIVDPAFVQLSDGRLEVNRVLNSNGEGLILGPGNVTVAGELRGRIEGASVTIDGTTTLSSLNVVDPNSVGASITVSPGARVQIDGNSGDVYLQVPFTLNEGAVFAIDNGFPHFAADVNALDGTFEVGVNGGVAFGFFGEERSFTINVGNADLRTASFAGTGSSTIDVVGVITASELLKVGDTVTLNVGDNVFAGAVQLQPGVTLIGNVSITGDGSTPTAGTFARTVRVEGEAVVGAGNLQARAIEISGGRLLCEGACAINASTLTLDTGGTLQFGAGVAVTVSNASFVDGIVDLAGGGTLTLTGSGELLRVTDGVSLTSTAPREHRVVVAGVEFETTFALETDVEIDHLVVPANRRLNISGAVLSGRTIELGDNAVVDGVVAFVEGCTGAGAANCP
jgi:hypothetical protein